MIYDYNVDKVNGMASITGAPGSCYKTWSATKYQL